MGEVDDVVDELSVDDELAAVVTAVVEGEVDVLGVVEGLADVVEEVVGTPEVVEEDVEVLELIPEPLVDELTVPDEELVMLDEDARDVEGFDVVAVAAVEVLVELVVAAAHDLS